MPDMSINVFSRYNKFREHCVKCDALIMMKLQKNDRFSGSRFINEILIRLDCLFSLFNLCKMNYMAPREIEPIFYGVFMVFLWFLKKKNVFMIRSIELVEFPLSVNHTL